MTDTSYVAQKVAIQPDGNLLVNGSTPAISSNKDFIVNRYLGSATSSPRASMTRLTPAGLTATPPLAAPIGVVPIDPAEGSSSLGAVPDLPSALTFTTGRRSRKSIAW